MHLELQPQDDGAASNGQMEATRGASEEFEGTWKPKIYFVGPEKNTFKPFWKFLREEYRRRNTSWSNLDALCDGIRLNQYAGRNSQGHPNEPTQDVFLKIIQGLGYQQSDFEVHEELGGRRRSYDRHAPEYAASLRAIGDAIRQRNTDNAARGKGPQLLSLPVIKKIAGNYFARRHANTIQDRMKILDELHAMGYTEICLQHQVQNKGKNRTLTPLERHVIQRALERHFAGEQEPGKMNVFKAVLSVEKALNRIRDKFYAALSVMSETLGVPPSRRTMLPMRSRPSIQYQVEKLLGKLPTRDVRHVSPLPNKPLPNADAPAEEQPAPDPAPVIPEAILANEHPLAAALDALEGAPELHDHVAPIVQPDPEHERRNLFLKFSQFGHQAIVAYLMNPEHHKALFGDDVTLITVDFPQDTTPQKLYDSHKSFLDGVKPEADDAEVTGFVDGWIRCDMIFRSPRGYLVVEVKQYAVDKEKYPNAQKARQQLSSYAAVLTNNVSYYNIIHVDKAPLPESVAATLAAFEVQEDMKAFLQLTDRGVVELDRDAVMAYVGSFYDVPPPADPPPQESNPPTAEPQVAVPVDSSPAQEEVVQEAQHPPIPVPTDSVSESDDDPVFAPPNDHGRAAYERKKQAGDGLLDILATSTPYVPILRWDQRRDAVEIEATSNLVIYDGHRLVEALEEGVALGKVLKGRVDLWKYAHVVKDHVSYAV